LAYHHKIKEMPHLIVLLLLLSYSVTTSYAQCGKKLFIISTKTEHLDGNGTIQRSNDEKSLIEITKSEITISPGNEQNKMIGIIKSDTCNWIVPYKHGKTIIKATFTREGENPRNATITIEGKDEKLTMLIDVDEMPDKKIRVAIDKFEEKK
jgi:hypothetical protein